MLDVDAAATLCLDPENALEDNEMVGGEESDSMVNELFDYHDVVVCGRAAALTQGNLESSLNRNNKQL